MIDNPKLSPYDHPPQACPHCAKPATHFVRVTSPHRPGAIGYRYAGCEDACAALIESEAALYGKHYPKTAGFVVSVEPLRASPVPAHPVIP